MAIHGSLGRLAILLLFCIALTNAEEEEPWPNDDLSKFDLRPKYTSHPMLYFTEAYIPIFRRKAETTHAHIMTDIRRAKAHMMQNPQFFMPSNEYRNFRGEWNEIYGNNLPILGLWSMLYPDDERCFDYIIQYMDNMCDVRWQVLGQELDEVPVSHSLAGFATTFDFIYPRLNKNRKKRYAQKIVDVTYELFRTSYKRWWGRGYMQNHVHTNTVALLIGALVSRLHVQEADKWIKRAITHYEKTLWLLDKVEDGSCNEGVSYGGYSARSLTEYIFLTKRHFNVDRTDSPWLKNHFWFYYATLLPGFQWTIGVGDSAPSWWYGPESQLAFLDNYVMKNGSANWLALQIRAHRKNNYPGYGQRWTTLHTEFIWFNASITPMPPIDHGLSRIHVFPDWGVATYGFAVEQGPNTTFLSFKSGATHGKTVMKLLQDDVSYLDGWENFNPGHEHPDKNSFVFAPNGVRFITEGLYGPKYTYLDNTLMFGPSGASFCMEPWVGQLGDCAKWLEVTRLDAETRSSGEIINTEQRDGFVHMSGEAKNAYPPVVGIQSYYRNLLLLNPQLLLVHDYIEVSEQSKIKYVSTFFNNHMTDFAPYQKGKFDGFYMRADGGAYRAIYTSYGGQKPAPKIETLKAKRYMSNVNLTFALEGLQTDIAYLFMGPDIEIVDLQFLQALEGAVRIQVLTKAARYDVRLVSRYDHDASRQYVEGEYFTVEMLPLYEPLQPAEKPEDDPIHIETIEENMDRGMMDRLSNSALMSRFRSVGAPTGNQCLAKCLFYSTVTVFIGFIIIFALATQMVFKRRRSSAVSITLGLAFAISLIVSIFSCIC